MENTAMELYSDAPTYSQSTSPVTSSDTSGKPYRVLPPQTQPPAYSDDHQPYRDDPPRSTALAIQAHVSPLHPPHDHHMTLPSRPYAFYVDTSAPPTPNNGDVPLAHLHTCPTPLRPSGEEYYPLEAPPAYSVAIGQSHDSAVAYYAHYGVYAARQGVLEESDEEAGLEGGFDDVGHSVEKIVAMFVVASMLLVLSVVLAWLALGSGFLA